MLVKFKKGIAVFMSCLIVFSIFSIYSFESVSAAEPQGSPIPESCCIKTSDDQYCIETENEILNCEDLRTGSCDLVTSCDLGTCVPASGECLSEYPKSQCEETGGVWYAQEENNVASCRLGCCKDTLERGVMQKAECPGDFEEGLTDPMECRLAAAPETLGCCVESNSCTYQKVESGCSGTFFEDQYCYERDFCNARYESHAYSACGDAELISFADQDVFWFDSNGNMEELIGEEDRRDGRVAESPNGQETGVCDYPDEICFDPDRKGGRENAYCKSNDCVTDCPNCEPNSFKHGESMCLRIFEGQYTNDKRSSFLEESIIYCDKGEVKSESPLVRSESVCIDGSKFIEGDDVSRMHAKTINNNWEACGTCGEGGGILDYGGYIPLLGGILLGFGSWCSPGDEANWFYGTVPPGTLGGGEVCQDLGNDQGVQMCYYDGDLWAPLGSCNPIYPPAKNTEEVCGECGSGGDNSTNMCTEQECNALGDCHFEEGSTGSGLLAAGAVALGTAVGIMAVSEGVCAAVAVFGGPPAWLGCKTGFLSGIAGFAGSLLYWGIFGLTVGLMGSSNQGYEEFDEYGYSFENEDGTYNLASIIAIAKAVSYELEQEGANQGVIDEGAENEEIPDISPEGYGIAAGLVSYIASTLVTGGFVTVGGIEIVGTGLAAVSGAIASALNVLGGVVAVFLVSESFAKGSCVPEESYTNSDHCKECGGLEGQFSCSQDRCNILGRNSGYCEWEPKEDGSNDGVCLPANPTDTSIPSITNIHLNMFDVDNLFTGTSEVAGHELETQEFGWFEANGVNINITTDEESKCRGSFEDGKDFESMLSEYAFDGRYTFEHTLAFNLTGQQKMHGENTFYIKCTDVNGNVNRENDDMNWIKMNFGEEPNEVPPEIVAIDPSNRIFLPEGTDQIDLRIIVEDRLDEVTECRYGYNISNYEDLPSTFNRDGATSCPGSSLPNDCYQFSNDFEFNEDDSVVFELESYGGNATIYPYIFGCIDDYGNSKLINYSFTVYPGFDMNITSPGEGDRIYDSTPNLNISLGIIADCNYRIDGSTEWIEFGPTVNTELEDALSGSVAGNSHTLTVKCRDMAYNEVEKSVNFVVLSDERGPSITRLYTRGLFGSGGNLYLELNEKAECSFNDEEQNFDFEEDGILMLPVPPITRIGSGDGERLLSVDHATSWDSTRYYVKCRDEWENEANFVVYP
jgi:hypothetical protein